MFDTTPIHLCVIDDSSNDTEIVSNMLRNAGHAVHTTRIEDDEDLREALGQGQCDMILAKTTLSDFTANEALDIIVRAKQHVPLLIIGDNTDDEVATSILNTGARDVVHLAQPARLLHAVLREVNDARQRQQLEQCKVMLAETSRRAQNLVDSSRDAITYIHEGMYIYANQSYLEMFGYADLQELEGMPILDMVKSDDHARFKEFLRDYMAGKTQESHFSLCGLRADGSDFEITMELSNALYDDEPCTQIIIRAQVNHEELERRLQDISKLDLLTNVFNRQYLLDELQQVMEHPKKQGALLYLQPDHFPTLREELGLSNSDQILTELASTLKDVLHDDKHFLARFEGEVFCALLDDASQDEAEAIAGQIVKAVDAHRYHSDGKNIEITCSIGISIYNEGTKETQALLQRANKAMHYASQHGGNQFHTYIPGEDEMAEQERTAMLTQQIRDSLQNNRLHLLFQPILSIKGDPKHHYEVFVRMSDSHGQEIPPQEFVPAAEKGDLATALDRWIIAHAIKAGAEQQRQGKPVVLFVKLSIPSLRDDRLLPWLSEIIQAARLEPNSLVLEVNEEIAVTNIKVLKQLYAELKQLHIDLAIDHFGITSTYSHLIEQCEAHYLKIAGTITGDLVNNPDIRARLGTITRLAKAANKVLIANAVEDPHTLAMIYSTGVDYIQGYFLQEPTPEMDYDFTSME